MICPSSVIKLIDFGCAKQFCLQVGLLSFSSIISVFTVVCFVAGFESESERCVQVDDWNSVLDGTRGCDSDRIWQEI